MFRFFLFWCFGFWLCLAQELPKHVVYFETDEYGVLETEQNRLLLFVKGLNEDKIKKISIYGFCDDRGSNHYNLILSQQRADAIKKNFL